MTDSFHAVRVLTPIPGAVAPHDGSAAARPRGAPRAAVADLAELARTLDLEAEPGPAALVEPLRAALRADEVGIVALERGLDRLVVGSAHATRGIPAAAALADGWLDRSSPRLGFVDPEAPEDAQQNVALTFRDLAGRRPAAAAHARDAISALGLGGDDLVRALVCRRGELLAWVGAFRPDPFGAEERAVLGAVVGPLRERLAVERRLRGGAVAAVGLAAALEALPGAAFLVRRGGIVAHANAAGRRLLDGDGSIRRQLADGGAGRFAMTLLDAPGLAVHWLAVECTTAPGVPARLAAAAERWRLTAREAQVLAYVAQGLCNKDVAAALGCAEATVERHVTSLLEKAGCDHRAGLVARLWAP